MRIKKCGFIVYHYNTLDPHQKFHKHSKSQTYTTIKNLKITKQNETEQNKTKTKIKEEGKIFLIVHYFLKERAVISNLKDLI